jgi:hypothetical protein
MTVRSVLRSCQVVTLSPRTPGSGGEDLAGGETNLTIVTAPRSRQEGLPPTTTAAVAAAAPPLLRCLCCAHGNNLYGYRGQVQIHGIESKIHIFKVHIFKLHILYLEIIKTHVFKSIFRFPISSLGLPNFSFSEKLRRHWLNILPTIEHQPDRIVT